MMTFWHTTLRLLVVGLFLFGNHLMAKDRPEKPNIVLLLTDDLGWQDVKCYDIDEPSPEERRDVLASVFAVADLCAFPLCDHERESSGPGAENSRRGRSTAGTSQ